MRNIRNLLLNGLLFITMATAQTNIRINKSSAEDMLKWFAEGCKKEKISELVMLKGNQLAEKIMLENGNSGLLKDALKSFNPEDTSSGKEYLLRDVFTKKEQHGDFLEFIKQNLKAERFVGDVLKFLPQEYKGNIDFEIFLITNGWQWGDANVFSYSEKDNICKLDGNGKLAMILNISLIYNLYGDTNQKRFETMQNVLSHELFHIFYADYKNQKEEEYFSVKPEENIFYTMLNEGMGHYLSERTKLMNDYPNSTKLKEREKKAFDDLNNNLKLIKAESDEKIKKYLVEKGTYGKFWDKYVCITGMFIAYHIEKNYGIEMLRECMIKGPSFMLKKYNEIEEVIHIN